MPFVIHPSRGGRRLCLALAALWLLAAPAVQAAPGDSPARCADQSFKQAFRSWNDRGSYTLLSSADMEGDLAGWALTGGAAPVAGNEPFHVGSPLDSRSLALPTGSSATSAPICVGINYPFFRLFARNTGSSQIPLSVDVLYLNAGGHVMRTAPVGTLLGSSRWAPSRRISLAIGRTGAGYGGEAAVAFRFTPGGTGGRWQIDDIYVDPYARR
ncbi:MAG: hypothetical protein ACRDK0_05615 [Solirubrobacteraceae bacterium]